jgi:hypothetical protein
VDLASVLPLRHSIRKVVAMIQKMRLIIQQTIFRSDD